MIELQLIMYTYKITYLYATFAFIINKLKQKHTRTIALASLAHGPLPFLYIRRDQLGVIERDTAINPVKAATAAQSGDRTPFRQPISSYIVESQKLM